MSREHRPRSVVALVGILATTLGLAGAAGAQTVDQGEPTDIEAGRGFFQAGYMALDLGELNASLTAAGLPELDERVVSLGGAGFGVRGRLLIGGEGHALLGGDQTTADGSIEVGLSGGYGLFRLGYLLLGGEGFLDVYPMVGIGGGSMSVRITERSAPTFDDVLVDPQRSSTLSTSMFLLDIGLGADYRFVVSEDDDEEGEGGVLVGVHAGYTLAPGDTEWTLDGINNVAGGPAARVEGFYLRLSIGGWGWSPGED